MSTVNHQQSTVNSQHSPDPIQLPLVTSGLLQRVGKPYASVAFFFPIGIPTGKSEVATDYAKHGNVNPEADSGNPEVDSGYAKHGNVNPEVDSGYAKHGNVNPEVDSGNPEVDSGYAKHGNVNPEVNSGNPEVDSGYAKQTN
ncbi:hypothetical protein [Calothrix sp. NIES-2100]|uniref:hypothetical protein n=1 Tax=Calothrix sp. NIES-2100 TaxID=1954172 RepID=UPI0030D90AE9